MREWSNSNTLLIYQLNQCQPVSLWTTLWSSIPCRPLWHMILQLCTSEPLLLARSLALPWYHYLQVGIRIREFNKRIYKIISSASKQPHKRTWKHATCTIRTLWLRMACGGFLQFISRGWPYSTSINSFGSTVLLSAKRRHRPPRVVSRWQTPQCLQDIPITGRIL